MVYMRQLDGLRAIAILAVMFEHYGGATLNRLVPIGAGNLGVNLFFTLSGFLITGMLLSALERDHSTGSVLRRFFAKRILRLAPVFYVWLAVLAVLGIGSMASSWPWHAAYLSNFHVALGGEKTVFWSLAVEEQFYLLWPLVLVFAPRRHLPAICVMLFMTGIVWKVGGYFAGIPKQALNVLLPGSFEPLAIGCLLAVVSCRGGRANNFEWLTRGRVRLLALTALAGAGSAVLVWLLLGTQSLARQFFIDGQMALVYGYVVIMAAKGFSGAIGIILDHSATVYIGRISYGLYVVHNFMPDIVELLLGRMPKVIAGPIVLFMTFGLCALSYRLLETPIRRWGHARLVQTGNTRLQPSA